MVFTLVVHGRAVGAVAGCCRLRPPEELWERLVVEAGRAGMSPSELARRKLAAERPLGRIEARLTALAEGVARIESAWGRGAPFAPQSLPADDRGDLRYDRGVMESREPGESVWRERVDDGRHAE